MSDYRSLPNKIHLTRLLVAAETLFLGRGFSATTMDDIARAAGMSKKTVYQVIPSKRALFEKLMTQRLALFTLPPDDSVEQPDLVLRKYLLRLATLMLSPKHVAFARMVATDAGTSPQIGGALEARCLQGETGLHEWIVHHASRGTITISDTTEAARRLFSMTLGDFHYRLLLGIGPRPTEQVLLQRIDWAVDNFFQECRVRPKFASKLKLRPPPRER